MVEKLNDINSVDKETIKKKPTPAYISSNINKKKYDIQKQDKLADSFLQAKLWKIPTSIYTPSQLDTKNSPKSLPEAFWQCKIISKEQTLETLKNILTEDKLKEIAKKRETNNIYIDSDLQQSWTISFYIDFLTQTENKNLLNIVVENGLFDIYWVCPDEEKIKQLKDIYKQNKTNKVKEILKWYTTKDGNILDINKIFDSKKCKPIKLEDKLSQLVDENWNPISKEEIQKILLGVKSVKKIKFENLIKNKFKNLNQENLNNYINFLQNNWKFILKTIKESKNLTNDYLLDIYKNF